MEEQKSIGETAAATEKKRFMKKLNRGGRNLVILGVAAVVIAMATTTISLLIYHNSGDIYLDRSRPGFLPDEEEAEEEAEEEEEYNFSKTGTIDLKVLEEYLEKMQSEVKTVDAYEKPFEEKALSDESLGIPEE